MKRIANRGKSFIMTNSTFSKTSQQPFFCRTHQSLKSQLKINVKPSEILKTGANVVEGRPRRDDSRPRRVRVDKSPYLSEAAPIERMLQLLIPVHGPNESMKMSIKKHNQMNIKNA